MPLTKEIVGDGAFRVETTVKMTTDASGDEYLKGLKEQMLNCVADDRLIDPAVVVTGIIPGTTGMQLSRTAAKPRVSSVGTMQLRRVYLGAVYPISIMLVLRTQFSDTPSRRRSH